MVVEPKPPPAAIAAPTAPTAPGAAPPAALAADDAQEEKTAPHPLKQLQERAAQKRRRTLGAELIVKRPKLAEVRVSVDRAEMLIGRDKRCDLVLTEPSASKKHARLHKNDGGYFEIVDLGSKNGIIVNDVRVNRMVLMDADQFIIGDTHFTIAVGLVVGAIP